MKNVLIVGNSHVHSVKSGWDRIHQDYSDRLHVEFFVASDPYFRKLAYCDGVFGDLTSGSLIAEEVEWLIRFNGRTTVDLESYDAILLVGMYWPGQVDIVDYLKSFTVDNLYEAALPQRLTVTAFTEFYEAFLTVYARPATSHWSGLRRPKVSLMFSPMPLEIVRDLNPEQLLYMMAWGGGSIAYDKMEPLLACQKSLAQSHYASFDIDLLHQPSATLTDEGLTRNEFSRDQIDRAGTPDYKFDVSHTNGAFGDLCLQAWFKRVLA